MDSKIIINRIRNKIYSKKQWQIKILDKSLRFNKYDNRIKMYFNNERLFKIFFIIFLILLQVQV